MTNEKELEKQELLISAQLDGELRGGDKVEFERLLEEDEAFLTLFEKRVGENARVHEALRHADDIDVPDSVMAMLTSKPETQGAKPRVFQPLAMAASVGAVGLIGLYLLGPANNVADVGLTASIDRVLSENPSGSVITLNGSDATLRVNLSFVDTQGRHCREYYLQTSPNSASQRVACRDDVGWKTVVESRTTANVDDGYFVPASGNASTAVSDYLDANMLAEALNVEQEKEAISSGWKPVSKN